MSKRTVVFIDGNNLYHNLKEIGINPSDLDFLKFSDFICSHFDVERAHIIYYNSIPRMNDPSFFKHKKFLDDLKRAGIEVKTRKLQVYSTTEIKVNALEAIEEMKLCEKCNPIVLTSLFKWIGSVVKKEKGIDVIMAVDVIENTLEKKYDCYIVVSGDADLVSAMKFAEKKGGKIFSAFVNEGYSNEIRLNFKYFMMDRMMLVKKCLKD